jgi:hypothetical protein
MHVESQNNNADILTKPITNIERFNKLRLMMGMISANDLGDLNNIMKQIESSYLNVDSNSKLKSRSIRERVKPWKTINTPIAEYLHREQSYLRESYANKNLIDDMDLDSHVLCNYILAMNDEDQNINETKN